MDKISVLIVDDDREWCGTLHQQLEQYAQFNLMTPLHGGDEGLNIIEASKPDVIILDLMLPVYDGMYIIDYISDEMPGYKPFIYVLSALGSEKTNRVLRNHESVGYYSIKPTHSKTVVKNLFRFLDDRLDTSKVIPEPNQTKPDSSPSVNIRIDYHNTPEGIDWLIEDYLYKLGLATSMTSAKCARVAIEIYMKKSVKFSRSTMMAFYAEVAQTFDPPTSAGAVERNIRLCIKRIEAARTPFYEQSFLNSGMPIIVSQFVHGSANFLKQQILEAKGGKIPGKHTSELYSR